jgi:hypothetical protein
MRKHKKREHRNKIKIFPRDEEIEREHAHTGTHKNG